jgi:AbrB family looped-hinge helix DNA binding protein
VIQQVGVKLFFPVSLDQKPTIWYYQNVMNYQRTTKRFSANMTSKCQVTVPKEVRDALGLKPHDVVAFSIDKNGNAIIFPADENIQRERRVARILKGVEKARQAFKAESILPEGLSNQDWFQMVRGPAAER